MKQPMTLAEWIATVPFSKDTKAMDAAAIHTFSNGSEWECWAGPNCYSCRWLDLEGVAGEKCAFEAAAFLHWATPELATLFGWTQRTTQYGPLDGWEPPDRCAFFSERRDNGDYSDDPAPMCPETLHLFADQRTTHDVSVPSMAARRVAIKERAE